MAKKGKGKVIQMLSPENYIRQKARTLPVYECWVNAGWDKSQIASLIVSRQHTNGNITAGIYLVDLACLGVKDTSWFFNISMSEYRKNIEHFMEMDDGVEKIDYVLAHNIVYAGIEFAGEYEFKPHRDFATVTQYILDEDHEDIPVIEIECGLEGLPAYMQGPLHSDAKARQVVAQLERVAGHGNYYLINEAGEIIDDDYDDDYDPFGNMSLEDKRNEFADYFKRIDQLSEEEKDRFFGLSQSLTDDIVDFDKYDEYSEAFENEFSTIEVNGDLIPDEMLGVQSGAPPLPVKIKKLFLELINSVDNLKKIKKKLSLFRDNRGVEAAADYIELMVVRYHHSERFGALLNAAAEKYPCYGLLQMLSAETKIGPIDPTNPGQDENIPFNYEDFFPGRDCIHPFEFFNYLNLRTLFIFREKDLEKMEAWKDLMSDFLPDRVNITFLDKVISLFQSTLVASRLKIN
jgi:hypothetical protein